MTLSAQRCFIALAPAHASRADLAAIAPPAGASAVHPDDLHLTLAFLGATTPAQQQAIAAALPGLAQALDELAPLGTDVWPKPTAPRMWVAKFALASDLRDMVMGVNALVAGLRLPLDTRPYVPHITLARFDRGAQLPNGANGAAALPPARLAELILYASTQASDGPRYRPLARAALGASV
jgi:2'-5' RNA ligase